MIIALYSAQTLALAQKIAGLVTRLVRNCGEGSCHELSSKAPRASLHARFGSVGSVPPLSLHMSECTASIEVTMGSVHTLGAGIIETKLGRDEAEVTYAFGNKHGQSSSSMRCI